MDENPVRVVLDTNILISAFIYRGNPEIIARMAFDKLIHGIISPILLVELNDTLYKKFNFSLDKIQELEFIIRQSFEIIFPYCEIHVIGDEPDNRLLEAAIEGNCQFIVTGDKELLRLGVYKNTQIVNVAEFLRFMHIQSKN